MSVAKRRRGQSIRGGGVGGAPPPRTGFARGNVPHFVPLCNTIVVIRPTKLERGSVTGPLIPCKHAGSCGGWGEDPNAVNWAQDCVQELGLQPGLQSAGAVRTLARCPAPASSPSPACSCSPSSWPPAEAPRAPAATPIPPRRSRPARRSTSRAWCGPRATSATTCSTPRARCCAPSDPEAKLHELIDEGLKESDDPDVTYEKDIAPWLGQKAGVWVSGVDRAKPGYVVLVATKDTDKAQAAIDKGAKGQKSTQRSYHGVDYQVDAGRRGGRHRRRLLHGRHRARVQAHGRRATDGDSLADDKRYTSTIDELDDDRIGSFYVDLKPFIEQALKSDPNAAGQLEQIRSIFPIDKLEPLGGALLANGDRIAFDTSCAARA